MQPYTLNNGVIMPPLGFGTYSIPPDQVERSVRDSLDCGYRMIDTAQWYGNETEVGRGIVRSGVARSEIFLVTKLQSGRHVRRSVAESMRRLGVDYLDLLLIHWPMGQDEKIWREMEQCVARGEVRAIGLSNFYGEDFENILRCGDIPPQVIQQELHPFRQQTELVRRYHQLGIVPQAWSPLACGRCDIFTHPLLADIGAAYGKTPAQVALRFLVQCGICPLPKSGHKNRMRENIDIFDFSLSPDELISLRSLDQGHGLFGWYD